LLRRICSDGREKVAHTGWRGAGDRSRKSRSYKGQSARRCDRRRGRRCGSFPQKASILAPSPVLNTRTILPGEERIIRRSILRPRQGYTVSLLTCRAQGCPNNRKPELVHKSGIPRGSKMLGGQQSPDPRGLFKPDLIFESGPRSCSSKHWKGRERTHAKCYIYS